MSKPPCAWCRDKGAVTKPTRTKGWVQVTKCLHCDRFQTDLEAAKSLFFRPKVIELDEILQIVAEETDCVKR